MKTAAHLRRRYETTCFCTASSRGIPVLRSASIASTVDHTSPRGGVGRASPIAELLHLNTAEHAPNIPSVLFLCLLCFGREQLTIIASCRVPAVEQGTRWAAGLLFALVMRDAAAEVQAHLRTGRVSAHDACAGVVGRATRRRRSDLLDRSIVCVVACFSAVPRDTDGGYGVTNSKRRRPVDRLRSAKQTLRIEAEFTSGRLLANV